MAQATESNTTSRRNFLVIAGGLAASAAPLVSGAAVEPAIDPELIRLRHRLYAASEIVEARNQEAQAALDYFDEWKRNNPEPVFIGPNGKQDHNFAETCSRWETERDAAAAERSRIIQAHLPAIQTFTAIADELYHYDAKTFAEILFKAEVANICDTQDHTIAHSLTYDILNFKQAATAQI